MNKDLSKMITNYWDNCLSNDGIGFNYEEFFLEFTRILKEKLALHGMLTLENYITHLDKYYDFSSLNQYAYEGAHLGITSTVDSIKELIFRPRYMSFRRIHLKNAKYRKLFKLHSDLLKWHDYNPKILMERCISAEHNSGVIIGINIDELRKSYDKRLENSYQDKVFGILNRNGLEEKIHYTNKPFNFALIDFNGIHNLNESLGYNGVNEKVRKIFSSFKFRKDDIVGRWFSGDEIIIISHGEIKNQVNRFSNHCRQNGMSFKYKLFYNVASIHEMNEKIDEDAPFLFTNFK